MISFSFLVSLPEFDLPVVAAVVVGVVPLPAKTFSSLRKCYLLSARYRFQYGFNKRPADHVDVCDLTVLVGLAHLKRGSIYTFPWHTCETNRKRPNRLIFLHKYIFGAPSPLFFPKALEQSDPPEIWVLVSFLIVFGFGWRNGSHLSADAPRFHISRVAFAEAPFTVGMRRATILAFVPVTIII